MSARVVSSRPDRQGAGEKSRMAGCGALAGGWAEAGYLIVNIERVTI
jgi:hypothetical protein